jgi:hypothetical protein
MASTQNLNLTIDVVNNGPDLQANITVEYDLVFSRYDQDSDQPYLEVCRLIGKDAPPEDGVDDAIPGGQLFPVLIFPPLPIAPFPVPSLSNQIASDGRPSVHRRFTKTLPLSALNEDATGQDEIRAQVTLTPVLPVTVIRESNQVALNL